VIVNMTAGSAHLIRPHRTVQLPFGAVVPALGQGTWHFAEDPSRRRDEIAALRLGLDLGLTLIDTAEMYADGEAEVLVGEAINGRRDEAFLVSKVLPENAGRDDVVVACDRSLRRLRTDRLDLYLLHWRGNIPLDETVDGFEALVRAGKIRSWGVSNFDVLDMQELYHLYLRVEVATDQVLYNLMRRGIELDLMPWCIKRSIPIMAYSPIEQGRLLQNSVLMRVAARHDATPAQVALAWVLRMDGVIAIPRAGQPAHVRDNCRALDLSLSARDLDELERAFPPPADPQPLGML
jgi:diketogulonate reductase-like aldo/keto reductase